MESRDMEKKFDFNQVDKKMPYTVPEGFFDKMETVVMAKVRTESRNTERRKSAAFRWLTYATSAVACLIVVVTLILPSSISKAEWAEQELCAFDKLSSDDQDYLLEAYADDIFLNEFNQ